MSINESQPQEKKSDRLTRRGKLLRGVAIAAGVATILTPATKEAHEYVVNRVLPALDAECFDGDSPSMLLDEVSSAGISTAALEEYLASRSFGTVAAKVADNGHVINVQLGECPVD